METVSWDDCQKFCRKLSEREGRAYRLPTEAEWEFACRAETTTAYCYRDNAAKKLRYYAWYHHHADWRTHPVGVKKPNAWTLYDMHGNVWEWCQDWYGAYPTSPQTDPQGPSEGSSRVVRGGSWSRESWDCRSATRWGYQPESRHKMLGLRLVMVPSV